MTPKDVQAQISGICEYVKFTGKNTFCRYDKTRVLEMWDYIMDYLNGTNVIKRVLIKKDRSSELEEI